MARKFEDLKVQGSNPGCYREADYNQNPVVDYTIEWTQIIQRCGTLASTVTLIHGGIVGGDK